MLSLPQYHHSTLLPTATFLTRYTRFIRRLLCPRPWIQADQALCHFWSSVFYIDPRIHLYASLLVFFFNGDMAKSSLLGSVLYLTLSLHPQFNYLQGFVKFATNLFRLIPTTPHPLLRPSNATFIKAFQMHNWLVNWLKPWGPICCRGYFLILAPSLGFDSLGSPGTLLPLPFFDILHRTPTNAIPSLTQLADNRLWTWRPLPPSPSYIPLHFVPLWLRCILLPVPPWNHAGRVTRITFILWLSLPSISPLLSLSLSIGISYIATPLCLHITIRPVGYLETTRSRKP